MATVGLYGSSSSGVVAAASGSESTGLYGNNVSFGGSYFEWFIFQEADLQPATPTGGSWDFSANTGVAPTGWSSVPPSNPTNKIWVSIAVVNSKNASPLVWSAPGLFSYASGLPILSGNGVPGAGVGQSDQLYIQLDTTPQTIWFKETGTWTRLTGSNLYVDLISNQTIAGTKTFGSQIQGSVSGTAGNVTGVVGIVNGGTGSTTASGARTALGAAASGANSDITSMSGLTGGISTPDNIQFDTTATATIAKGNLRWNTTTNTLSFGIIDGTDEINIGEQMFAYVTNADSVTITRGQPVYLFAATGNRASVKLASNLGDSTSAKTLGLAAESIAPNASGFVITQGVLDKLNTNGFAEGATLYLGATAGTLTSTKPQAPNHLVYIGVVERSNAGNGQIYVKPQNGYELDELHDVQINSPVNGQTLVYDQSTSLWKNANLTAGTGISITNGPSSITISAPDTGTVTSVNASGGSTGLTFTGGPITSSGTLTLGGTLAISSGGTGGTTAAGARTNLGLGSAAVLNAGVANGVATLDAGGTVPLSQIPASIQGGVSYQGTWNASTNTPTLTSSVGTKGYYYVVSVAGSTNLNGVTSWNIGDWAIFNGTAWEKVDNTDAVTSVNGFTGTVVLDYTNVGAPSTTGVNATGTWGINISGNAATVTNGVYTSVSYADPTWLTSLSGTKISGNIPGNAANVTGTVAIANGGTGATTASGARTNIGLVIGTDIPSPTGTGASGTWNISISGNAATATTATSATTATTATNVSGGTANVTTLTASADSSFTSTGALLISKGTTAQQPGTPSTGMIRYNSTTNQFEGYSGASPAWKSIGGSTLTNDTATNSDLYPVFSNATSGTAENLYTSNAKLLYRPSTGELQAAILEALNGIVVSSATINTSYSIPSGSNAMSTGPVSVASGVTVTVPSGSVWTVI